MTYAVAKQLGFARTDIAWKSIPFRKSFKPGKKDFDLDINQISYSPARAKAVDFSDSYYDVNQALVATKGTKIAGATTIGALKGFKLGAPIGTTSYDTIVKTVKPSQKPGRRRRRGRSGSRASRRSAS